ncbi:hypothetical protein JHD46_02580 [Sulfurimonas sp. SAG-AH-194-C20]|nr:hypothetical protein [Sulfurimonas sp. SAG-AH-194-C20]MDF1878522.1 hypothetical protein [Sulfurimonas sp. SAG-AH-194-C20]
MSALTTNERDGLDEVFLSIHSHTDKYKKIKEISILIMSHTPKLNIKKLIKVAKYGLNETKKSRFILNFTKKKKNLSK